MECFEEWERGRCYGYSAYRMPLKGNDTQVYERGDLKSFCDELQLLEKKWWSLASSHEHYRWGNLD